MKFEHFALNVADPLAMAAWYVEHLGLKIVRQMQESPFITFLADSSGTIMLEIYNNPAADIPPYRTMHPLLVHLAFVSVDPSRDSERLLQAGASLESNQHLEDGSQLLMMRDPWGFAIQFCKRGTPMLQE
ncbi:50S ribosomal protein L14 [Flammeovirgaceae bacterium 311]|nr:50S ribosomal protein L14 [Flammeovirgaceae bacterium 311]